MEYLPVKHNRGVTLIEVMIAILIVAISAIGSLAYQYFGAKHIKIANADFTATRLGQLLLEDWKAGGGVDTANYDPTTLGIGFQRTTGSENGNYKITLDGITMYFTLSWRNISSDDFAGVLRLISVTVQWRNNYTTGNISAGDPSLILTTYCRRGTD